MKQAVAELKDNLELSSAASGIDSLVQYFYDHTVSFLDYFTEKDSLIILDERPCGREGGGCNGRIQREYDGQAGKGLCAAGTDRGHL